MTVLLLPHPHPKHNAEDHQQNSACHFEGIADRRAKRQPKRLNYVNHRQPARQIVLPHGDGEQHCADRQGKGGGDQIGESQTGTQDQFCNVDCI